MPADKEHRNSFLKIDRYANMFGNFLKNFWSQLKDPTRFGILSIKGRHAGRPESAAGVEPRRRKKTDAVENSSNSTRLSPRQGKPKYQPSKSRRNGKEKNETQQQAAQGDGESTQAAALVLLQRVLFIWINWGSWKNFGLSPVKNPGTGLLDQMLRGLRPNQVAHQHELRSAKATH